MQNQTENTDGLLSWDSFLRDAGLSHTTGWRWKKAGFISAININGRLYVRRSEMMRFLEAAARGDYAKESPAGRRNRKAVQQ